MKRFTRHTLAVLAFALAAGQTAAETLKVGYRPSTDIIRLFMSA